MKFDTSMSKSAIPEERLHMTDPVCTGEVSPPKCDTVHYRLTPVTGVLPTRVTRADLRMGLFEVQVDPDLQARVRAWRLVDGHARGPAPLRGHQRLER